MILNAVDTSKFKPPGGEKNRILHVGRLVWRKEIHVLVKAAKIFERIPLRSAHRG